MHYLPPTSHNFLPESLLGRRLPQSKRNPQQDYYTPRVDNDKVMLNFSEKMALKDYRFRKKEAIIVMIIYKILAMIAIIKGRLSL
jgi:hypothetical protein